MTDLRRYKESLSHFTYINCERTHKGTKMSPSRKSHTRNLSSHRAVRHRVSNENNDNLFYDYTTF